jgi:hypothetical protein
VPLRTDDRLPGGDLDRLGVADHAAGEVRPR